MLNPTSPTGYPVPTNAVQVRLYQLLAGIHLTPEERALAAQCQKMVRRKIQNSLQGIERDFLSGSYARNTSISPLKDIDIIFVLDKEVRRKLWHSEPGDTLKAVAASIRNEFDEVTLRTQNRSVRIKLKEFKFTVDIVPAFASSLAGCLEIPDRRASSWLLTDPESVRDESPRFNEEWAYLLKPIIRILKKWKRIWGEPLRPLKSFYLEMMCYSIFNFPLPKIDTLLLAAFEHIEKNILKMCPDPVNSKIDLGAALSNAQRRDISRRAGAAAYHARVAIQFSLLGKISAAHDSWSKIFPNVY